MFLLLVLSTLALAGGTALASRFYRESRAERALAGVVLALFVVHGSAHVLGWTNTLTPTTLGALAAALSVSFFAAGVGGDREGPARAMGALADLVRLPVDALRLAIRERSPALLGVILIPAVCAWTLFLSYLAPSSSWDGTWYHEPMVFWALRNHGFALVDVPANHEWANGYPRFAENLMLWSVAWWDRRLIEGAPSFMGLVVWLGMFVLARRVTPSRVVAIGCASVMVTVPAVVLQMRSTYIDIFGLAMFLPGIHFATRSWGSSDGARPFRRADAWMTGISVALLASTKSNAPVFASFLLLAALASTFATCRRERSPRTLIHALGAFALFMALVAPPYLRNWEVHHNPLWPLSVHSPRTGIDWTGSREYALDQMQIGFGGNLTELYGVPGPAGQDYHDTRHHAYGYGLSFLGIPMLLIALTLAFVRWLGGWIAGRREVRRDAGQALALFFLALPVQLASPAHHWGRYSLPFPAIGLVVIAWAFGRGRTLRLGDAAFAAMLVLNGVTLAWADPGWDVSVARVFELLQLSPAERAHVDLGNQIYDPEYLRLRDRTIGPGDVVAFTDDTAFISNLWNERMENDVVFIPFAGRDDYRARLDAVRPIWVVVRPGSPADAMLRDEASGYHALVLAHLEEGMVYARGPAAAAP